MCNADTVKEASWYKVQHLLTKYRCSVENLYHHGEELVNDHHLNPQYVCRPCADAVQDNYKRQKHAHQSKKQKQEKSFLPRFMPSATDCKHGKCNHLKPDLAAFKATWQDMDERVQCEFLVFLVQDLRASIKKVGGGKNAVIISISTTKTRATIADRGR